MAVNARRLKATHFLNPINWFIWPIGFTFTYLLSRPYFRLGPALLAIAITISVFALYIQQRYQGGRTARVQQYQRLLGSSLQAKNYRTALICSNTLIDLVPNDFRFQFERAKIEKELGNDGLSDQLIIRLATQKRYGRAALYLAETKFDTEKMQDWKPEDHELFRTLIGVALSSNDREYLNAAKFKMAGYLTSISAYSDALRYLSEIIPENPQLALTAMELAYKTNDKPKLDSFFPLARDYFTAELKSAPDNVENRLKLARTFLLNNQISETVKLLEDGMTIKKDISLQNALGEALVFEAARITRNKQDNDSVLRRMQTIHRASEIAPNNPLVVAALIDILIELRNYQDEKLLILRDASLKGLTPKSIHFVRGTVALLENNLDDAKLHLELAAGDGDELPGILNNLAVAMASSKTPDLEQALRFSDAALSKLEHPYLFETRGQILFKMGRYQDCISDLEMGLQAEALESAIYPSLITAYTKLGNKKMATEYEALLNAANKR